MNLFISYSHDDKQWVDEFALKMGKRSTAWHDTELLVSQKWWDEILNRVEWCDCFVLIMTPKYALSPFCIAEMHYAIALNKPIIVLLMKDVESLPDELAPLQYFNIKDLLMGDILAECAFGLNEVQKVIYQKKHEPPNPTPKRPDVPRAKPAESRDPFAIFDAAENAGLEGDLDAAEKEYKVLKQIDPDGFGKVVDERLDELRKRWEMHAAYDNAGTR